MKDRIIIKGIEFYAHHGVSDQEQEIGHRYFIDIEITADLSSACVSDNLQDTISYSDIAQVLIKAATTSRFRLLEKLAGHLAQIIMDNYPKVLALKLKVGKKLPPVNAVIKSASIEILRIR